MASGSHTTLDGYGKRPLCPVCCERVLVTGKVANWFHTTIGEEPQAFHFACRLPQTRVPQKAVA